MIDWKSRADNYRIGEGRFTFELKDSHGAVLQISATLQNVALDIETEYVDSHVDGVPMQVPGRQKLNLVGNMVDVGQRMTFTRIEPKPAKTKKGHP
jgi:hypothetical protein